MSVKVIYTAGPFRPKKEGDMQEVHQNIERAKQAALAIWREGHVALCPHANTGLEFQGAAPDEVWLEGDLVLLERCDAVLLLPGWKESSGVAVEMEHAERCGIPAFESFVECIEWANSN